MVFQMLYLLGSIGYFVYRFLSREGRGEKPVPKLENTTTFNRDSVVPIVYGQYKLSSTIIYIGNIEVVEQDSNQKTKGDSNISWILVFDFAIAIGEGIIGNLLSIYADDSLIPLCQGNLCTVQFISGTNTQNILPEISAYLTDGTALPWRNTSYAYISGYVPTNIDSPLPNISVEINGIENNYTESWEATTKYSTFLRSGVFNSGEVCVNNIYYNVFYPYPSGSGIPEYSGIWYYSIEVYDWIKIGDLSAVLCSNYLDFNLTVCSVIDNINNRIYYLVFGVHKIISGYRNYSLFYIDCNTNTVYSVIQEYIMQPTDFRGAYINLSCPVLSLISLTNEIWFFGTISSGFFSENFNIGAINVISGLPVSNDGIYAGEIVYLSSYIEGYNWEYQGAPDWATPYVKLISFSVENGMVFLSVIFGLSGLLNDYADTYSHMKLIINANNNSPSFVTIFNLISCRKVESFEVGFWQSTDNYGMFYDYKTTTFIPEFKVTVGDLSHAYIESKKLTYGGQNYYVKHEITCPKTSINLHFCKDSCSFLVLITDSTLSIGIRGGEGFSFVFNSILYLNSYGYYYDLKNFEYGSVFSPFDICSNCIHINNEIYDTVKKKLKISKRYTTPVWCLYDFLTNTRYGCGISSELIDGPCTTEGTSFYIAHSYCIEDVPDGSGNYEKRYLYNNAFISKVKGYDIINDMLQTCKGILYFSDGKIKILLQTSNELPILYFGLVSNNFISNVDGTDTRIYADFSSYLDNYLLGNTGICVIPSGNTITFLVLEQTDTYIDVIVTGGITEGSSFSVIFTDDFESGNLDNWENTGSIIVTSPVHSGVYSVKPVILGKTLSSFISTIITGYFEFYIYLPIITNYTIFGLVGGETFSETVLTIGLMDSIFYYDNDESGWKTFSIDPGITIESWIKVKIQWDSTNLIFYVFVNDIDISNGGISLVNETNVNQIGIVDVYNFYGYPGGSFIDDVSLEISGRNDFIFPKGMNFTLTLDNIKKETFEYKRKNKSDCYNKITLNYNDSNILYKPNPISYSNEFDINETGEIRERTFNMTGIVKNSQARRMLKFLYDFEQNIQWFCSFETDIIALQLDIGSIICISLVETGWDKKLFRVIEIEELDNYEYKLSCIEYLADIYNDELAFINYDTKAIVEVPEIINSMNILDSVVVEHITKLFVYEDSIEKKIYVLFNKPFMYVDKWAGADLFISFDGINFIPLETSIKTSISAMISTIINEEDIIIYFNPASIDGGSFTENGSIFIDEEEIYYRSIDIENGILDGCIRGYNNTIISSHSLYTNFYLRKNNYSYYLFDKKDVGKVITIRALSFNVYQQYADDSNAPEYSLNIYGKYYFPYTVYKLLCERIADYFVLNWYCKTKSVSIGYGGDSYGNNTEGYGGGSLLDISYYVVNVYRNSDDYLCRSENVIIADRTSNGGTYVYSYADNIADNGHFETDLYFLVYQADNDGVYSQSVRVDD